MEGLLPTMHTGDFAHFVGKFCFDFDPHSIVTVEDAVAVGHIDIEVTDESGRPVRFYNGELMFLAFDDERSRWPKVEARWASSTCEEKRDQASLHLQVEANSKVYLHHAKIYEHLRPRFWHFAFVGCGMDVQPDMFHYKVHVRNVLQGFQEEFSVDHTNMFYVYLVFSMCFVVSGLVFTWIAILRPQSQDPPLREHPYIQFLAMAYSGSAASCILFLIHYGCLIHSGYGSLRIRFLGVFVGIAATSVMYAMSLFASVGWAISRHALPYRRTFIAVVGIVFFAQGACEFHAETALTQSTKLYGYSGSLGVMLLILKLFLFFWFGFQVKTTFAEETDERRRRFYRWLGFGVGAWAVTLPIVVVLADFVSPWVRYKVVTSFDLASRYFALAILTQLFCGPLSPLSHENIFALSHMVNAPETRKAQGWRELPAPTRPGSF